MKSRISFTALTVGSLFASPALAQTAPPSISVSGEATISVAPDLAWIDAGVMTDAKTAREASDANNAAMGKMLLALKAAGIDEKDFQTSRLSLQSQTMANPTKPPTITGYRAGNRVTIKLHDVTKVAAVIDMMVAAGANDIGGINFTVTDPSKLLDEARARAVADSRRKAEIYAKAAGVALGGPLSISEQGAPGPMAFRRMSASLAAPTTVAQGEETLQVSVGVSWAIKPEGQ